MGQPEEYARSYSFKSYQSLYPNNPLPATPLDNNLDDISLSIGQIINRLKLIQRDDGGFKNKSVDLSALSNDTIALLGSPINPRGQWAATTEYKKLDLIEQNTVTYICVADHTSSGAFSGDYSSGLWITFTNPALDEGELFYYEFPGTGTQTIFPLPQDLGIADSRAFMVFIKNYGLVSPNDFVIDGAEIEFINGVIPPYSASNNVQMTAPSLTLGAVTSAANEAKAAALQTAADVLTTQQAVIDSAANVTASAANVATTVTLRDQTEDIKDEVVVLKSDVQAIVASAGGDMKKADNLAGLANVSAARTNLGLAALAIKNTIDDFALLTTTVKDAIASYVTTAARSWSKGQYGEVLPVTSSGGVLTLDLSLSNNFSITLTENTLLANPPAMPVGQEGFIHPKQHASSAKTFGVSGSYWAWATGSAEAMPTTLSAEASYFYTVASPTKIWIKRVNGGVS